MKYNKNTILGITAILCAVLSIAIGYKIAQMKSTSIRVIEYRTNNTVDRNEKEIQKHSNINAVAWINDEEVLTLTKKSEALFCNYKTRVTRYEDVSYCSVYNLITKEEKKFEDVSIVEPGLYDISPDGRYVLYKELDDTKSFKNLKVLDLHSGETKELNIEDKENRADYFFISNEKFIMNNANNMWSICDIYGNKYANGELNGVSEIFGVDEIEDLGDIVNGKLYMSIRDIKSSNCEIATIDINTKEIKNIASLDTSGDFMKKSTNVAILGKKSNLTDDKYFTNKLIILNKDGTQQRSIDIPEKNNNIKPILSDDGKMMIYISDKSISPDNPDMKQTINLVNISTGEVDEIIGTYDLKNRDNQENYTITRVSNGDSEDNVTEEKSKGPKIYFGDNMFLEDRFFNKKNNSIIFRYKYVSKDDGKQYVDTYTLKIK